jgi:hypothetical protein
MLKFRKVPKYELLHAISDLNFIDMHFNACVTSVDPDQLAHLYLLNMIYAFVFLVRNNLMNLKLNSVDPDQRALMCRLIWIYTVCQYNNGVSME